MAVGRPRTFNMDVALDRALEVFWRKGYEGASVADLTAEMGISPPSLYAAFGNKEGLFRKAIDRYEAKHTAFWEEALSAPTAYEALERLLKGTAQSLGDKRNPRGCLMVQGALCASDDCDSVKKELDARRNASTGLIRDRLKRAKREGELPETADPASLANFFAAVTHGMAVQAAGGATPKDLERIAQTALQAWPG